jgi:hypothetical protein
MQLSVAQQMVGLPKFRQHSQNSGYIEGWALYAEQLGKEVGFYQDPVSDYGRLSSELFRAVRLVVDTQGWSRDQVVAFMRQSGAVGTHDGSPGRGRRDWARWSQELGSKFDLRAMLSGGVLRIYWIRAPIAGFKSKSAAARRPRRTSLAVCRVGV